MWLKKTTTDLAQRAMTQVNGHIIRILILNLTHFLPGVGLIAVTSLVKNRRLSKWKARQLAAT